MTENGLQFFNEEELTQFGFNNGAGEDDPIPGGPAENENELELDDLLNPAEPAGEEDVDDEDLDPTIYEANFEFLKDSGFLVLPEDFVFSPNGEGWNKALEESNKNIQEMIVEDMFQNLNEEGKLLLNYYLNGGTDISKFKETVTASDVDSFDIGTTDGQRAVVEEFLRNTTSFSAAEMEDYIDFLVVNDTLESKAEECFKSLEAIRSTKKEELVKSAKAQEEAREEALKSAVASIRNVVESNRDIYGVPFSKEDSQMIVDSLFKPIKLADGTVTTSYESKYYKAMSDPKKAAVLVKLLENDFDMNFVTRKAETDATRNFRQKIKSASNYSPGSKGKSQAARTNSTGWENIILGT